MCVCVVCFYVRDTAMLYVVVLSDNVCAYNYKYTLIEQSTNFANLSLNK